MNPDRRINESHGLWELAVTRLAAFTEAGATRELLKKASADERDAFKNWQRVSREVGA
jgi:hypothetical protein